MPQSQVHITTNEQRELYYNALIRKIAEFKRFKDFSPTLGETHNELVKEIDRLLREAISFKDMFDIKSATFSLTRDDVNLLTHILNTSA